MRALALLLVFLQLSASAFAGDYALMLNMNYSTKEWDAFKASSEACGRTPISVPPVELLPLGEAMFAKRDALAAKIRQLRPNWKKDDVDQALEEIMRSGKSWQGDPQIAAAFANDISELATITRSLNKAEAQYGSISDQFEQMSAEIRKARGNVKNFAISAHADGWNFTGESANRLSWGELDEVMKRTPGIYRDTQNVLLLGCYNMTENNRPHWRSMFPYASMIAGFGVKAPSRTTPVAKAYITENLDKACELDEKMARTGRPLDPAYAEQQFKKLPSVRGTQSVIDYCYQIIEGQPGSGNALNCDEQWTTILAQAEIVQNNYMDLRSLKKDPPKFDSATSEVRAFYSALQNTCPASNALQMKGQEEEVEHYRQSMIESTIRLIFWWKVQKNFNTYFANDLAELEQSLGSIGVKAMIPALDGKTGRVEFVQSYNAIKDEIEARKKTALRLRAQRRGDGEHMLQDIRAAEEKFAVLQTLFFLQGETTVQEGANTSAEAALERGAIPFNWIEGTVLKPRQR